MINTTGIIMGLFTLLAVGVGFLWVIKFEYYFGARIAIPVFGVGIILIGLSFFVDNFMVSAFLGILAGTVLWGAVELPHQEERVREGIFPANPARLKDKASSGSQTPHSHDHTGGKSL
jgi:hypothetical protein